eukprot:TRINITY_DN2221_c0_g2_i1.p1 TRINITY_DN2221_c0_g2~~TRINITY_DN2221_c0_g2_i1.p1  ORF type:complete len:787 (-),score=214.49 TRINITY_DN2221_c0_g2_i1:1749-4109(-)
MITALLVVGLLAAGVGASTVGQIPSSFDCAVRKFALEYASTMPAAVGRLQMIHDALQVDMFCNETQRGVYPARPTRCFNIPSDNVWFVDAVTGSDQTGTGAENLPFNSIQRALDVSRNRVVSSKTIVLREGTYFLGETLKLDSRDSGLTIQPAGCEEVWISGGKVIEADWKPYAVKGDLNIWVTDVPKDITSITGLRVNGERAVRARFPNANPETMGIHTNPTGWISSAQAWAPAPKKPDSKQVLIPNLRNDTVSMFQKYTVGIGGNCDVYDPPVSFWCSKYCDGGGAFIYHVPSGLTFANDTFSGRNWKNWTGAIVQAWREYHWASWMFEVDSYDFEKRSLSWTKGGFQGARGADRGAEWFVENVFDELDAPNEWYFSTSENKLYYFHNATTGVAPTGLEFVATQVKTLINVQSPQQKPVENLKLVGLGFRDTAYTYMDPHGVPSGGDWALQRSGAVFLEGTSGAVIDNCAFFRLDGNALMISGYNSEFTLSNSIFSWIGDSAVAQWGYTDELSDGGVHGYDGVSNTQQPRGSLIENNFIHEVGIFEKQSSFYFQAKSCQNTIRGNVMFNGPRAGINFNDGFGGGNVIEHNLIFNCVRESGDHGPFNSWDRQPFLTTVRDGKTPSFTPAVNEIRSNFIIGTYQTQDAIDNDDGSAYYHTHHNFFSYGDNGIKSDFDGHDNIHESNVYAYVGTCGNIWSQLPGHNDGFFNNYCVTRGAYLSFNCNSSVTAPPVMHNNSVFTASGAVKICGVSLAEYQKQGHDLGSKVGKFPADADIVTQARKVLGL